MSLFPITDADFIRRHSILIPYKHRTGTNDVKSLYICGFILGGCELFAGLQMSMNENDTLLSNAAQSDQIKEIADKYQHIWAHIGNNGQGYIREPHSTANLVYTLVQYDVDFLMNNPKLLMQVPLLTDKITPCNRALAMLILKKAAFNYQAYTPWYRTALVLSLLKFESFEYTLLMNIWQNTAHTVRNMKRMATPGNSLYNVDDAPSATTRHPRYESWKGWIRDFIAELQLAPNDITKFTNLQAMLTDFTQAMDVVVPIQVNGYRMEHLLPLIQNPAFQIAYEVYKANKSGSLDMNMCDDLMKKYRWDLTDENILDHASYTIAHLHTIQKYGNEFNADKGRMPTSAEYTGELVGLIQMLDRIRMLVDPFVDYAYSIQLTHAQVVKARLQSSSDLSTLMFS